MADRTIEINFAVSTPKEEPPSTILGLTEIVLGLSDSSRFSAVERAQMELLCEAYESGAGDDEDGPVWIPSDRILTNASYISPNCEILSGTFSTKLGKEKTRAGRLITTSTLLSSRQRRLPIEAVVWSVPTFSSAGSSSMCSTW
jgi:hypothetical protein